MGLFKFIGAGSYGCIKYIFQNKDMLHQNKRNSRMKKGIFKRKNISMQVSELMGK